MHPVQTKKLALTAVHGADDDSVRWRGGYATYGGSESTYSSTVYFEIDPGGRLGWHTDSTEETQCILAGSGEIQSDDGNAEVTAGDVFVLPEGVRHDLVNTGSETLRAVAFFSNGIVSQNFDNVMLPPNSHILGSPNSSN